MKTPSDRQKNVEVVDNLICWSFCSLLFLLPLVFSNRVFLSFELAKVVFFNGFTALIWLFLAVKFFLQKRAVFSRPSRWASFLFFGYLTSLFLAAILSDSPYVSFWGGYERQQGLFQTLFYLVFFGATIFYFSENKKSIHKVIKAILYGAIAVSILAVLQKFFPSLSGWWNTDDLLGRQASTMGHPNFLAAYLVIVFPFFYVFKEKYWKLFSMLILTALFLTGSRGGAVAIFVEIILMSFVFFKSFSYKRKILIYFGAVFFLSLAIISRLFLNENFNRSIEVRLLIWRSSIEQIFDRPFFGYGPEMFENSFMNYTPAELLKAEKFYTIIDRAHNEIVDTAINIGLVGLIFYFAFIFWLIKTGFKNDQKGAVVSIIGLLTANMFGFSTTVHFVFFWFLAGIIVVSGNCIKIRKIGGLIFTPVIALAIITGIFTVRQFSADANYKQGAIATMGPKSFEAIGYFRKAIELNPYEPEYFFKAGEYSLLKAEDEYGPVREEYIKEARWFIASLEEKLGLKINEVVYLKAILMRNEQNYPESLLLFKELGEKAVNNPKYILEWARTFKEIGYLKSALEKYKLYIDLTPAHDRLFLKHNPDFQDVLTEIDEIQRLLGPVYTYSFKWLTRGKKLIL